jgi:hypothetical protein
MSDNLHRHWFTFLAAMAVSGCATTGEQARTGFLSDYSKLERAADNQWRYTDARVGEYEKFFIEPVATLFERREDPSIRIRPIPTA